METGKEGTSGGSLNTLAQTGTKNSGNLPELTPKTVEGKGSDLSDKVAWRRRAKRKTIAQNLALNLVKAAEKKGEPERIQAYWNTFHCQNYLTSAEGRVYGRYCKNRFCPLCCSIRKADIINRYWPILCTWEDPYFVTLTIKSVKASQLKRVLHALQKGFRKIRDKYKKRNRRGKGIRLMGIKALESNFNSTARTYNPHFHLIVPSKEIAETLMEEWLQVSKKGWTHRRAQHMRPVDNLQRDLIETIKYGTKIFTEPDMSKRAKTNKSNVVYAAALDTFFAAMKGIRQFERFGFNLPKAAKSSKVVDVVIPGKNWLYRSSLHDWVNPETGERLTGYVPTPQLQWMLAENIDTDLQ